MQKAVISPLNNVTFKGGDQHSEGGDQQKKTSLLGLLSEPKMSALKDVKFVTKET